MSITSIFNKIMGRDKDQAASTGADQGSNSLKANAEKALAMKQAAAEEAVTPPHRTAHEGMRPHPDPLITPGTRDNESNQTEQFGRSHGDR